MYIKLVSSDGHEFIVKREHALTLGTRKAMLRGPEIPSCVLSKACTYFTYKFCYTNSSTVIPEFPIAPETALELLMTVTFLDP
ncbi:unnamed protein product [Nyctereutes procyonoides]|uniref:Elongin-C n=1 Tax=Nyctereutes procyonoides TaxID=34880 RepID=A0A811YYJ3_NYCPR|nr:unnamed protein product [Nyctereutes procyonoides]